MEAKVLVCILVFLFGVSHSARDLPQKCTVKRQNCDQPTFLTRYYFNETKKRCLSFFACAGEGDNFYPRMVDCVKDCRPRQRPPNCFAEKRRVCTGDTFGETAWTYDLKMATCEQLQKACGVTKNNFVSREECVAECHGFDQNGLLIKYREAKEPSTAKEPANRRG
ncbi:actinia tenebrosa protease inhibitors-like [Ornithodoros turicata]|uniref:actinia tenebrosa protease inhibitors-like n=1 Tax=Ornithodoros turicata TaxID=34597 RepID=UPI0031399A7A